MRGHGRSGLLPVFWLSAFAGIGLSGCAAGIFPRPGVLPANPARVRHLPSGFFCAGVEQILAKAGALISDRGLPFVRGYNEIIYVRWRAVYFPLLLFARHGLIGAGVGRPRRDVIE